MVNLALVPDKRQHRQQAGSAAECW